MTYFFNLLEATMTKSLKYLIRYKFNTIFSILMITFVFFAIALGYKSFGKNVDNNSIEKLLGGYIVWSIMVSNLSSIVTNLVNETNLGTLEQLYISSRSFYLTLFAEGFVSLLISLFHSTIVIFLISLFSSNISISFLFNFIKGLPLIFFGIPAIWGLSLMVSSLALFYKNVSSFYTAISSILFAAVSYGVHKSEALAVLFPFGLTNVSLQNLYNTSKYPSLQDISLIIMNSIFYILLGVLLFIFFIKKSKINGKFSKH